MTLTDGSPYAELSIEALLKKLIGTRQTRELYRGSLQPLFAHPTQGQHQNEICAVARELVKRWLDEEIRRDCNLSAPSNVRDYLRLFFAGKEHESFVLLLLDAQNRLIVGKELFRGTLTQTSVYPREVVKEALAANAGAAIFAHNHPSGCSEPSRADELLTQNLKSALALVDVKVLDHLIVAGASTMSFAERGLL